jgi:hypothetical protein
VLVTVFKVSQQLSSLEIIKPNLLIIMVAEILILCLLSLLIELSRSPSLELFILAILGLQEITRNKNNRNNSNSKEILLAQVLEVEVQEEMEK